MCSEDCDDCKWMNVIMNMAAKITAQTRSLLLSTRTERKLDAEPIYY